MLDGLWKKPARISKPEKSNADQKTSF